MALSQHPADEADSICAGCAGLSSTDTGGTTRAATRRTAGVTSTVFRIRPTATPQRRAAASALRKHSRRKSNARTRTAWDRNASVAPTAANTATPCVMYSTCAPFAVAFTGAPIVLSPPAPPLPPPDVPATPPVPIAIAMSVDGAIPVNVPTRDSPAPLPAPALAPTAAPALPPAAAVKMYSYTVDVLDPAGVVNVPLAVKTC
jgi:hypothetical protein